MSHPILIKVQKYLENVSNGGATSFAKFDALAGMIKKRFERRQDKFRLRLSNVGRPICQLQMEASGAPKEPAPYNSSIRNLYGDIAEALAITIMQHAGVNIIDIQKPVSLDVNGHNIKGTLDVTIDEGDGPKIWDIKSASKYSFQHKFTDFNAVAADDAFGYIAQGYGYSKAEGKPFGGWIVVNKEDGQWTIVPTPLIDDTYREKALKLIEYNVNMITSKAPLQRCYTDEVETYRKKPTGNRVLGFVCSMCQYKQACWGNLEFRSSIASVGENAKKLWYTHIDEKWRNAIPITS